jgi:hypothetical protein
MRSHLGGTCVVERILPFESLPTKEKKKKKKEELPEFTHEIKEV